MWSRLSFIIGYPLLLIIVITIVAAVLLGVGTALTFLFAVSVWEATAVVTVVAAGAFWIHFQPGFHDHLDDVYLDDELEGEPPPPRVTVADFVVRPNRRSRRRKR